MSKVKNKKRPRIREAEEGLRVLGELEGVMMDSYHSYKLYKFQIVKILTIVKDTNVNYSKSNLLSVETHFSCKCK